MSMISTAAPGAVFARSGSGAVLSLAELAAVAFEASVARSGARGGERGGKTVVDFVRGGGRTKSPSDDSENAMKQTILPSSWMLRVLGPFVLG